MHRLRLGLLGLALTASFYFLLIDTPNVVEVYVLAAVALLGSATFVISREQGFAEASIRLAWFARIWTVLASIPVHIVLLCWEAIAQAMSRKRVRGRFHAIPFDSGADDSATDTGRRAVAEIVGSLAPNTIVVGVDSDKDLLLVHQLRRRGGREQLDVLRLG